MRTRLAQQGQGGSASVAFLRSPSPASSVISEADVYNVDLSQLDQASPICAIELVEGTNNIGGEVASLADLGNLTLDLMHPRYAKPGAKVIGRAKVRGATGESQLSNIVMVTLRFGGVDYPRKTVLHTGNFPRSAHHVLSAATLATVRADLTALLLGKQESGVIPYLPLASKTYACPSLRSSQLKVGEKEKKSHARSHKPRVSFRGTTSSKEPQPTLSELRQIGRAMDPYSDPPLDIADDTAEIDPMLASSFMYEDGLADEDSNISILDEWCGWTDIEEVTGHTKEWSDGYPRRAGVTGIYHGAGKGSFPLLYLPHSSTPVHPTETVLVSKAMYLSAGKQCGSVGLGFPQPFQSSGDGPSRSTSKWDKLRQRASNSVTNSFLQERRPDVDLLHSPNGVNGVASQLVECFVSEPVVRKYYEQQEAAGEKTHPWDLKAEQCLQIALRPENFNPSLPSRLRAQIVSELSRPDRICVWSFAPGVFRDRV